MRVILHSNSQSAAEATARALAALPMADARFLRDPSGKIIFDSDGAAWIDTSNPHFVAFAIIRQGYVKQILPDPRPMSASPSPDKSP